MGRFFNCLLSLAFLFVVVVLIVPLLVNLNSYKEEIEG